MSEKQEKLNERQEKLGEDQKDLKLSVNDQGEDIASILNGKLQFWIPSKKRHFI